MALLGILVPGVLLRFLSEKLLCLEFCKLATLAEVLSCTLVMHEGLTLKITGVMMSGLSIPLIIIGG